MKLIREKDIEAHLRAGVEKHGGKCYKWVSPGKSGVPDRIVIMPNRGCFYLPASTVFFVELKAPGKVPSALQGERIRELKALGQHAGWLSTFAEVDVFLECGILNEV